MLIIQIDANFIQKSLMDYLNEGFPVGIVKPAAGAAVVFGTKDILISGKKYTKNALHAFIYEM